MRTLLASILLCGQTLASVAAQNVIAPPNTAGVDGNSSLSVFGTFGLTRFQQVYSSSLFASYPEGVRISSMVFRGDSSIPVAAGGLVSIEAYLSTTPMSVDGLSPRFDENLGPDAQLVRGQEPFRFSVSGSQPGQASAWSALLVATGLSGDEPFLYNPAAGNLLLDIRIFADVTTGPVRFDAVDTLGDSVSSLYGTAGLPAEMGQLDTRGLATFFAFEPVPEPGVVALLAVGAVVVVGVVRRKGILRKRNAHGSD